MNEDYALYSDEELIIRLRDGEESVTEYLMNKYKNLVRSKAKSMYILGADNEGLGRKKNLEMWLPLRPDRARKKL